MKLWENIKFQKLNREILNDAVPKIILSNIDSLSKVMDKFQKLFEKVFIKNKNRIKIIYQTWCPLIPSRTEEDNFWSTNAPKVRTFHSGLRNNKRNRDLLPHVSRRCFDKDVKLTYYMHEMISMGRVDRISVFETMVAEEGRERREWSRSAFSCSLTNRSPVVLRTSHRSHLPAPRMEKTMEKERRAAATTTTKTTTATLLRTVSSPTPLSSRRSYPPHCPHSCTVILGKTSRMTSRRRRYALTSAIARNLQWPRAKYASSIFVELAPYTGR